MSTLPGATGGNDFLVDTNGNDTINGLGGNDVIIGLSGDDTIDGGTGVDTMIGGSGNDIYFIDNTSDQVVEGASDGTDTVISSLTNYTLANEVENLTLSSGSANLNGTGNGLNNVIAGNTGNNTLNGGGGDDTINAGDGADTIDGGTGADSMEGGAGDDVFFVDNAGDVTTDTSGTDTVRATVSHTIGTGIENLILQLGAGTIGGTGNSLANTITGNESGNTLDGGAGNDSLVGGSGTDYMVGGDGQDTFFVDEVGDTVVELAYDSVTNIDSANDTVVTSLTSYTLGSFVERLILQEGTGATYGTGNTLNNVIVGNSLHNSIDGGTGADVMQGGDGFDTYYVDNTGDVVTEFGYNYYTNYNYNNDTVISTISYTLANFVENLTLQAGAGALNGTGNSLNNVITGNESANQLFGLGGNDSLVGGAGDDTLDGGTGADVMNGGADFDTYYVDNAGDVINEEANGKYFGYKYIPGVNTTNDSVFSTVSYTLGNYVENLTLQPGAGAINGTGNQHANILTGNEYNNVLNGMANDDSLVGGDGNDSLNGGLGNDVMTGGDGFDTYFVDSSSDVVNEYAYNPSTNYFYYNDTVVASISYTLGAFIENLQLATGAGNINGTGNAGNNSLTGNSGNNTLDGGGGVDFMTGGTGNDTYIVDDAFDNVNENSGGGNDTVISSVDYTLTGNIENLTLTGAAVNGTGDGGSNVITGNGNDNILDGQGGADFMVGGAGNDTFYVDNAGDQAFEVSGEGTNDTVFSSVSFTIGDFVENLVLTGSNNINGTGNGGVNSITGNDGNNTLSGGAGADVMTGGDGYDTYIVDNPGDQVIEYDYNYNYNYYSFNDKVEASISYVLGDYVEHLTLTGTANIDGTGNASDNVITGNSGNNSLDGGDGNDELDGGNGVDVMVGGDGFDTFYVDNYYDQVIEYDYDVNDNYFFNNDSVIASTSYSLGSFVENLTLSASAGAASGFGNNSDNVVNGNNSANSLFGNDGNDRIFGYGGIDSLSGGDGTDSLDGGTGADIMYGGDGFDTFFVDNTGDQVIEYAYNFKYNYNSGNDTVVSAVNNYTIGNFVENLQLANIAGVVKGTGNALDNVITGNTLNNQLFGLGGNDQLDGGTGADSMTGGLGNDTYIVDNVGDKAIETNNQGTADLVVSSVSFTLGNYVENLTLNMGSGNLNGTGNTLNNILTGNDDDNSLNGGTGADTMFGLDGNDTFFVDVGGDQVFGGDDTDIVFSKVSFTLGADVENLTMTGTGTGTGNGDANILTSGTSVNTLLGMAGNDQLFGNGGNDILNGGLDNDILDGGIGKDTMTGGTGQDTFHFSGAVSTGNADIITTGDFTTGVGGDIIDISDILVGYNGNVSEYVQVTQVGANSIVKVDVNGLVGGNVWTTLVTVNGTLLNTNEVQLVSDGNLVVT